MKMKLCVLLAVIILLGAPLNASAAKIVIDAGHGGADPGALGLYGLREKDVNLDIAERLNRFLAARGHETVMTRQDDTFYSLADRVRMTNEAGADLFVSVHANWHTDAKANGSMVLYYDRDYPQDSYPASADMIRLSPASKSLAALVQRNITAKAGTADKGLLPSAAYVIRMGSIPSILVETAFLSNPNDAAKLNNSATRQQFAEGIAQGIIEYISEHLEEPALFPDMSGHWAHAAVMNLVEAGIVEGDGNNRFSPDRAITRAEWLTMADRLFRFSDLTGAEPDTVTSATYQRKDLPAAHWAYETFTQAIRLGFINGYEDQTVRPDKPITRSEVASLWERMTDGVNKSPWTGAYSFADVPPGYWAAGPIYRLKAKGILEGVAKDRYAPAKSLTRAEAAVLIDRYLRLEQNSK